MLNSSITELYKSIPIIWWIILLVLTCVISIVGKEKNEFIFGGIVALLEAGFFRLLIKIGLISTNYYYVKQFLSLKAFAVQFILYFVFAVIAFKVCNRRNGPTSIIGYLFTFLFVNSALSTVWNYIISLINM
mgnify:CR=1 FL=1